MTKQQKLKKAQEITEITLKVVINGKERMATFLRPDKIDAILRDKEGKFIDWINDLAERYEN